MNCEKDSDGLKEDIYRQAEWVDTWQIMFNADKCKIMHFSTKYGIKDRVLKGCKREVS